MTFTHPNSYPVAMHCEFSGEIWFWRGPSPYYFITVPEEQSSELEATSGFVTYGWGMIPVTVTIGDTKWTTSLFPKDGAYLVPLRSDARRAEKLDEGDTVRVRLEVAV